MITEVRLGDDGRAWQILGGYEHEVHLRDGELIDLKADFGLLDLVIKTTEAYITMKSSSRQSELRLRWISLESIDIVSTDEIHVAVEDGLAGIIGIRMAKNLGEVFEFELEGDWFRMTISCRGFLIDEL